VVSWRSSFLRLIRSFSVSASRRAAWILACISSPDMALELAMAMVASLGARLAITGSDGVGKEARSERKLKGGFCGLGRRSVRHGIADRWSSGGRRPRSQSDHDSGLRHEGRLDRGMRGRSEGFVEVEEGVTVGGEGGPGRAWITWRRPGSRGKPPGDGTSWRGWRRMGARIERSSRNGSDDPSMNFTMMGERRSNRKQEVEGKGKGVWMG
jgi:hypothetical protein